MTRRHSSNVSWSHGTNGTIAAALTVTSSLPALSITALCSAVTDAGSPMSQATANAFPPIALATSLAPSPLMSTTATVARSCASRSAMARPIPCAAPVTIATRPSNRSIMCPPSLSSVATQPAAAESATFMAASMPAARSIFAPSPRSAPPSASSASIA